GIGDVVMEMPALRALRAQWPQAHLTALGAWPALELLAGDAVFNSLAGTQDFGFHHWWDDGTEASRRKIAGWLREQDFQLILDATHAVTGIRQQLAQLGAPILDTGGYLGAAGAAGARSIWRSAVDAWGLSECDTPPLPRLHIPERARRMAERFVLHRGLSAQPLIGLAPVASSELKRWPLDRICELVGRIAAAGTHHLLVFGIAGDDRPTINQLQHAAAGRFHRVEPMHLQHTAALITHCQALVSNDTGLMHMSAAVGTPTVAVFGPTAWRVALPVGAVAVSSDLKCGYRLEDRFGPPECILRERCLIGAHSCIATVSVDAVHGALRHLLA
ncbi:MAG: glycosyltransferase family 9 protein, partial [Aquisalimonadaceae bacterium]